MSTVVILQSAYIPWKGYFHLAREADLFIFYDDLQYTYRDWRNRNKIMTPEGPSWLTIPTGCDKRRMICEVEVPDQSWKAKHRRAMEQYYARAPYFRSLRHILDFLYDNDIVNLSAYNQRAIQWFASLLHISTPFADSRTLNPRGKKTERLIDILTKVSARRYLSGPTARGYLDESLFHEAGIELIYFDYPPYPVYPQRYGPFCHQVSIVDLLFNTGSEAPRYIWE